MEHTNRSSRTFDRALGRTKKKKKKKRKMTIKTNTVDLTVSRTTLTVRINRHIRVLHNHIAVFGRRRNGAFDNLRRDTTE